VSLFSLGYNLNMLRRLILTSGLVLLLFACAPITKSAEPTSTGIQWILSESTPTYTLTQPIDISLPIDTTPTYEIASAIPTLTLEPTLLETAQPVPTLTPNKTAQSTVLPQPWDNSATIQIYNPGPLSKVISPVVIYGYAVPGYKNKGRVDLYGEDGTVLESELLQLNTVYKWAFYYWPIHFKINSAGELGRLSMSTQDEYGRTTALNSIHLLLLPEGSSIIYPPGELDLNERCRIEQPAIGQKGSGGTLTVSGKIIPFNNLPLTLGLIGRDGSLLNSQLIPITPDGNNFVPFKVDMPYSLQKGAWELLVVSQYDDRIGGLMYLHSQEVFLNP
jgi:hypothetical protein